MMRRLHTVLLAAEPFIEFEEPDVSAVALRSEIVCLAGMLANRMAASDAAPVAEATKETVARIMSLVLHWAENKKAEEVYMSAQLHADVRDALNRHA